MDLKGAEIRNLKDLCVDIGSKNNVPLRINIPFYQRPYKWDIEHIDNLVDDFYKNKKENQQVEYFVGSVVLVKNINGTERNDVIDGQQRITTVFLLNYLRMILLRAYIEESLNMCRINLDSYFREFLECYTDMFGNVYSEEYSELIETISDELENISAFDDDKNLLYKEILEKFQKKVGLPYKDITNIEQYKSDYEKLQFTLLQMDNLALEYSRDSYNDKLKRALSKIIVLVNKNKRPEILVNDEDEEDADIGQYTTVIKEEFDKVKECISDSNCSPMSFTKKMINAIGEIIENIKFCVILTGDESDAYTLFEVLNDRAMDIEDIDLIKNLYYKEYCNKSGESNSKILDKNIEQLDLIWSEEVFSRDLGSTCVKLISYLGAIYLTANEDIYMNKIERYRKKLEQEYFERYYSLPNNPYTYEHVMNDINVYRMLKVIIKQFKLPFQKTAKTVIDAECNTQKSITYRAMHLLNALNLTGVMPAITNMIIKTYMETNVAQGKKVDIGGFTKFVDEIIDDSQHSNDKFYHIHKWSYEIWRTVLYAKDYNLPRELAKKIIADVNYNTYSTSSISIDIDMAKKMHDQFIEWTTEWKYGKKDPDLKIKVLFINLFKMTKDDFSLRLNPVVYTFSTDNLQLDHLEAANPSDVAFEKYFHPKDNNQKREQYVNGLGNFMILDSLDNNQKDNKPLYDALTNYNNMCPNHWLIDEIDSMLQEEKFHIDVSIQGENYPVPNEEFFSERRARLQKYFQVILNRKLDETEMKLQ